MSAKTMDEQANAWEDAQANIGRALRALRLASRLAPSTGFERFHLRDPMRELQLAHDYAGRMVESYRKDTEVACTPPVQRSEDTDAVGSDVGPKGCSS